MIVTGASAGPKDGESPMGTSILCCSACAIPNTISKKIQMIIFLIIFTKKRG